MKYIYRHILIIGLIALFASGHGMAQKKSPRPTRIKVEYIKDINQIESLVATLTVKDKRYGPFTNTHISFFVLKDTAKVLLGKILTNKLGIAKYTIKEDLTQYKDTTGLLLFEVSYNGNATSKSNNKKLEVRQASLNLSFYQKDTIKYIEVNTMEIGSDNELVPIVNKSIMFYIQGTFSLLTIGKEKTDALGNTRIEFPVDMPGDTSGIITIIVKVEEDRSYGTVETLGKINWGIPLLVTREKDRGLGDTDAPLWMVYTLITLLSIVWFHYFYVIYMIIKIRLANRGY